MVITNEIQKTSTKQTGRTANRWIVIGVTTAVVIIIVALAWWLIVPAADWLARHDVGAARGATLVTARNNARGTLLTLSAGVVAAGALLFTARNFGLSRLSMKQTEKALELTDRGQRETARITEEGQRETSRLAEQAQVTERYTQAIGQLGSDSVFIQIGGIYALERIALDSARDHAAIMHVLNTLIDEHSSIDKPTTGDDKPPLPARRHGSKQKPSTVVEAAIIVLGRVNKAYKARENEDYETPPIMLGFNDLTGGNFMHGSFDDANFSHARLAHAYFMGGHFTEAHFMSADLRGAQFSKAGLCGADFTQANLTDATFILADLSPEHNIPDDEKEADALEERVEDFKDRPGPVFPSRQNRARFVMTNLTEVNLTGAKLSGSDLSMVVMAGADLTGAELRITKLLLALLVGAKLHNADLTGADLRGAKISAADFSDDEDRKLFEQYLHGDIKLEDLPSADFTGANLTNADFEDVNLTDANFTDANFTDAILVGADFTNADLTNADLTNAILVGANLTSANLTEVDLSDAKFLSSHLTDDDLAKLLDRGVDPENLTDIKDADFTDAKWSSEATPDGWTLGSDGHLRRVNQQHLTN